MRTRGLDVSARELFVAVSDENGLRQALGAELAHLADHTPTLLRLLHRAAFDLALPVPSRHLAAAAALYLQEPVDFLADRPGSSGDGVVDNVYVGWAAFSALLRRHGPTVLARLLPRAQVMDELVLGVELLPQLAAHVPPRVLGLVDRYLALPILYPSDDN
jgi:hypothetical protein